MKKFLFIHGVKTQHPGRTSDPPGSEHNQQGVTWAAISARYDGCLHSVVLDCRGPLLAREILHPGHLL